MKLGLILPVILVLGTVADVASRGISEQTADRFVSDLLNNPGDLSRWVSEDELAVSRRLGISYDSVLNKFLVSYDVDDEIRTLVKNGASKANRELRYLEAEFSLLSLTVEPGGHDFEYYFAGDRLVSPIRYYSRDWHRIETEFFVVFVSDRNLFNDYSAERLDAFVADVLNVVGVSEIRQDKLKETKIYYFLCKNTDEIHDLTGYNTRGMYNLAYDYIISTYNCHYHEIVHLLVNYKLEKVTLYTHPFFQEGIAVALGGRGGKEPLVIRDVGIFLEKSQITRYQDLLSFETFVKTDASLSYPVSGLYNAFLINHLGADEYLGLYKRYSGEKARGDIPVNALPTTDLWKSHLRKASTARAIEPGGWGRGNCDLIYADTLAEICEDTSRVYFRTAVPVLLDDAGSSGEFVSTIFKDLFPECPYEGEKYLITADMNEISVYNLYTNNLVAKYVPGMSVEARPIVVEDHYFRFTIDESIFDDDLHGMTVKVLSVTQ